VEQTEVVGDDGGSSIVEAVDEGELCLFSINSSRSVLNPEVPDMSEGIVMELDSDGVSSV
jgi:hypothetical protein